VDGSNGSDAVGDGSELNPLATLEKAVVDYLNEATQPDVALYINGSVPLAPPTSALTVCLSSLRIQGKQNGRVQCQEGVSPFGFEFSAGSSCMTQLEMRDLQFDDCARTQDDLGGAVLHVDECDSLFVSGVAIRNATSISNGGAIRVKTAVSFVTLNNVMCNECSVRDGVISSGGGGLLHVNGTENVTNVTLMNVVCNDCVARDLSRHGGMVMVENCDSLVLDNTGCNRCRATQSGGAVFTVLTNAIDMSFSSCTDCATEESGSDGGWLATNKFTSPEMRLVRLRYLTATNCTAANSGGAFLVCARVIDVDDVTASECHALSLGGGFMRVINMCLVDKVAVRNFHGEHCTALGVDGVGGAFDVDRGDRVILEHSSCTDCVAAEDGGFFATSRATYVDVFDVTCTRTSTLDGDGGCIDMSQGEFVSVAHARGEDCSTGNGGSGGLIAHEDLADDAYVTFDYVSCVGCSATGGYGGMIYSRTPVGFEVRNSTCTQCVAKYGGMMATRGTAVYASFVHIFDSSCTDCTASTRGGMMLFYNTIDTVLDGISCTACTSGNGGVAYVDNDGIDGEITIGAFTATNCTANTGGAIIVDDFVSNVYVVGPARFNECHATSGNAGVLYVSGVNAIEMISLNDMHVVDCDSSSSAGAVYVSSSLVNNISVLDFHATRVSSSGLGGVMYVEGVDALLVSNASCTTCRATMGSFFVLSTAASGSTATLRDVSLRDCLDSSTFGAITLSNVVDLIELDSVSCVDCESNEGSLLSVLSSNSPVTDNAVTRLTNVHCERCTARVGAGGAVRLASAAQLYVNSSSCANCEAATNAGFLMAYDTACTVAVFDGLTLRNVSALGGSGGAMFVNSAVRFALNDVDAHGCDASAFGGVAVLAGTITEHLSLTNVHCTMCSSGSSGGAVFVNDATKSVLVRDSSCTDCLEQSGTSIGGGAFVAIGADPTPSDSVIIERVHGLRVSGTGRGGLVRVTAAHNVTVTESSCTECSSKFGGALVFAGSLSADPGVHFLLHDSQCMHCDTSTSSGGAVRLGKYVRVELIDVLGEHCSAGLFGGFIYVQPGTIEYVVRLFTCRFCTATVNVNGLGGALYVLTTTAGSIELEQCVFESCAANFKGAGIYVSGGGATVTLRDVRGTDLTARRGALAHVSSVAEGGAITLSDMHCTNCDVLEYGGVVSLPDTTGFPAFVYVDALTGEQCHARGEGGALLWLAGAQEVRVGGGSGCTQCSGGALVLGDQVTRAYMDEFSCDTCESESGGALQYGNAVPGYSHSSMRLLNVSRSQFSRCDATAGDGGAINFSGGTHNMSHNVALNVRLLDVIVDECTATRFGGALSANAENATLHVDVRHSTLTRNRALDSGGALHVSGTQVTVEHSSVQHNNASQYGGGVLLTGSAALALMVGDRGTLGHNCAGVDGDSHWLPTGATLDVTHSTAWITQCDEPVCDEPSLFRCSPGGTCVADDLCECRNSWLQPGCHVCGGPLSCSNGGTLLPDCEAACVCVAPWGGISCGTCERVCAPSHAERDDVSCECSCVSPWLGDDASRACNQLPSVAQFGSDGASLLITDVPLHATDGAFSGCSQLFESAQLVALGGAQSTKCTLMSSSAPLYGNVRALFGAAPTIVPGDTLVMRYAGDLFAMTASGAQTWTMQVRASISGPLEMLPCVTAMFSAELSSGGVGRPLRYEWALRVADVQEAGFLIVGAAAQWHAQADSLDANIAYELRVTVTNYLLLSDAATHVFQVLDGGVSPVYPLTLVGGAPATSWPLSSRVLLGATIDYSAADAPCFGGDNDDGDAVASPMWQVRGADDMLHEFSGWSAQFRATRLGVGEWPARFVVTALGIDREFNVRVIDEAVAVISGGAQRLLFVGTPVHINGSRSRRAALYEWTCSPTLPVDACASTNSTIEFASGSLALGSHIISLRVQSASGLWSTSTSVQLDVVTSPVPTASLSLTDDSGAIAHEGAAFSLIGSCASVDADPSLTLLQVRWVLPDALSESAVSTTGVEQPNLAVSADHNLSGAQEFRFECTRVSLQTGDKTVGGASLILDVNGAPRLGSCVVSPLLGEALSTKFTLHCADFDDIEGDVVTYQFSYALVQADGTRGSQTLLTAVPSLLSHVTSALPTSPSGGATAIVARVCDHRGACAEHWHEALVSAPPGASLPSFVADQLDAIEALLHAGRVDEAANAINALLDSGAADALNGDSEAQQRLFELLDRLDEARTDTEGTLAQETTALRNVLNATDERGGSALLDDIVRRYGQLDEPPTDALEGDTLDDLVAVVGLLVQDGEPPDSATLRGIGDLVLLGTVCGQHLDELSNTYVTLSTARAYTDELLNDPQRTVGNVSATLPQSVFDELTENESAGQLTTLCIDEIVYVIADGQDVDSSATLGSAVLDYTLVPSDASAASTELGRDAPNNFEALDDPILFHIPLLDNVDELVVEDPCDSDETNKVDVDDLECTFFDEFAQVWSTDGCVRVNVSDTAILCSCTHLSRFSAVFTSTDDDCSEWTSIHTATLATLCAGVVFVALFILASLYVPSVRRYFFGSEGTRIQKSRTAQSNFKRKTPSASLSSGSGSRLGITAEERQRVRNERRQRRASSVVVPKQLVIRTEID
jgi:REJ domain/GPCR proteolysis site, GPS, motif